MYVYAYYIIISCLCWYPLSIFVNFFCFSLLKSSFFFLSFFVSFSSFLFYSILLFAAHRNTLYCMCFFSYCCNGHGFLVGFLIWVCLILLEINLFSVYFVDLVFIYWFIFNRIDLYRLVELLLYCQFEFMYTLVSLMFISEFYVGELNFSNLEW